MPFKHKCIYLFIMFNYSKTMTLHIRIMNNQNLTQGNHLGWLKNSGDFSNRHTTKGR